MSERRREMDEPCTCRYFMDRTCRACTPPELYEPRVDGLADIINKAEQDLAEGRTVTLDKALGGDSGGAE